MSLQEYEKQETLYANQSAQVSVFKAIHIASRQPVVLKEQGHSDLKGANLAIRETVNQAKLSHEHICKVYDCFIEQVEGSNNFRSVIVVELMQGDLMTEITRRKGAHDYWPEPELLWHMRNLASACASAQSVQIAHRDIKPPNIFIAFDGKFKLGDFGSSSFSLDIMTETLQGSPLFLSPELKEKFVTSMSYRSADSKPYDPFQSDVYSLGLTFLYMALLEPPAQLMSLVDLQQNTTELLTRISGYPTVQYVVQCMLVIEPTQRCTFQQIYDYINNHLGFEQAQSQGLDSSTGSANSYGVDTMSVPIPEEILPKSFQSGSGESATIPYIEYPSSDIDSRATPFSFHPVLQAEVARPAVQAFAERTRTCMMCHKKVSDRSWQTSLLPEEVVYQAWLPDICSRNCLSSLANLTEKPDHLSGNEDTNSDFNSSAIPVFFQPVLQAETTRPNVSFAEITRACMMCPKKVSDRSWQASMLPEEAEYQAYLPDICSRNCLSSLANSMKKRDDLSHRSNANNTCLYCSVELNLDQCRQLLLQCSHGFDTRYCLLNFLIEAKFLQQLDLPIECPRCRKGIDRTYLVQICGGVEKLYLELAKMSNLPKCVYCKRRTDRLLCGHGVCSSCRQPKRNNCQSCLQKHK